MISNEIAKSFRLFAFKITKSNIKFGENIHLILNTMRIIIIIINYNEIKMLDHFMCVEYVLKETHHSNH